MLGIAKLQRHDVLTCMYLQKHAPGVATQSKKYARNTFARRARCGQALQLPSLSNGNRGLVLPFTVNTSWEMR